jgi:hypothetical protein
MINNFQPINLQMETLISDYGGLRATDEIPPKWQQLVDHVENYKLLIAEWKPDDREKRPDRFTSIESNVATKPYPAGLTSCIDTQLKLIQAERNAIESSLFLWWTSGREKQMPSECVH